MLEVAGSLWSVARDEQAAVAHRLRAAGLRRLHWDMTDGRFAAEGGFDAESARALSAATGLRAEAHLMTTHSAREVDAWTGFCELVIVHAESEDWHMALDRVVARGTAPGLAISPQTSPTAVPADIPILCMSVVPGQAGSRFDASVYDKVRTLRDGDASRPVGLDGGVRRAFAADAEAAGASWLVVGTDLIDRDGPARWADHLTGGVSVTG